MRNVSLLALVLAATAYPGLGRACVVSAVGPAFGGYDTLSSGPTDAAGRVTLDCDPLVEAPTVALSAGTSGNFLARTMKNGSARLDYNLYADFTRSIVWGDGTQGSQAIALVSDVSVSVARRFSHVIYGRMPARQRAQPGVYSDVLLVTVSF